KTIRKATGYRHTAEKVCTIGVTADSCSATQTHAVILTRQDNIVIVQRLEVGAAGNGVGAVYPGTGTFFYDHAAEQFRVDIHLTIALLMAAFHVVLAHTVDHHIDPTKVLHPADIH